MLMLRLGLFLALVMKLLCFLSHNAMLFFDIMFFNKCSHYTNEDDYMVLTFDCSEFILFITTDCNWHR
uniref:Secreted protein n=1 Tax=Rhizophora mucronata TaxID=61149 RepID=A0A2P2PT41_RHIMU